MDRLVLTVVPSDIPLPEALKRIRGGTRALVVKGEEGPLLITASDITTEWNTAIDSGENPANVQVGRVVPFHLPTPVRRVAQVHKFADMNINIPPIEYVQYETAFDQHDDRYAIHSISDDSAVVVTASERFTAELSSSVTICTCAGDPIHTFERRQLIVPGRCNKPHGATVTCTA